MAHTRKEYIVYPPNYEPGDGFTVVKSRIAAKKLSYQFGPGSTVSVDIFKFPRKFASWIEFDAKHLWEVVDHCAGDIYLIP